MMRGLLFACAILFTGCATLVGIEDSNDTFSLASLEITGGTLVPAFDPEVRDYAISLTYSQPAIELAARADDPSVMLEIASTATAQGAAFPIAIPIGPTQIDIVARTTSGLETTYTIAVQRAELTLELVPGTTVMGIGMVTHVTPADVDGNGSIDLVYSATNAGVGVVRNDGTGRFTSGWHQGLASARGVAVGNLVGDAALDIAVTDGSLLVIRGRGDGTFDSPLPHGFSDAAAVSAGQIDGTWRSDIVVADGAGRVTALFGDATSMTAGPSWNPSSVMQEPRTIALGNVDHSPGPEIVQLDGTMNRIVVTSVEGLVGTPLALPAAAAPRDMIVADLDGDGRDEIVWIDPIIGVLNIQDAIGAMERTPIQLGGWASGLAAGDIDGDGKIDLVTRQEDSIVILRNEGSRTFVVHRYPGIAADTTSIAIADLDADGRGDVILCKFISQIAIYFGRVP